ncbi:glycerate kinase [Georgenia thermotolerans]|uniref:glycerate kinase n=1 Tax=Georgenia thermotolerans TaxID=527326 RepID=UPI001D0291BD|nr:glycerate kinase [Georgenia thermotolerans]
MLAAQPLSVLVAPDSFKGSASAEEVCAAVAAGVRGVCPDARVTTVPMADGGEGSLDALMAAWHVRPTEVTTVDALGRPCTARLGLAPGGRTAVVELAEASGLPRVSDRPPAPLDAHTVGAGELARAALDAGAEEVLVLVGGSASTDGGTGILHALGVRFRDAAGEAVRPGGRHLARIATVDVTGLHPRARAVRWRIAVDVDNPLTGPRGAAAVFGPQKGADRDDVAALERGLQSYARVLATAAGCEPTSLTTLPGGGAAGGVPVGLHALLGAELAPGSRLVADAVGLAEAMTGADLVITGEGACDDQSLHGKVVDLVATTARGLPRPPAVVVLAGAVRVGQDELAGHGVAAALSIAPGPATLAELTGRTAELLAERAGAVTGLYLAGRAAAQRTVEPAAVPPGD